MILLPDAKLAWVGAIWLILGATPACTVEEDPPAADGLGGGAGTGGTSATSGSGGGGACYSPANPPPQNSFLPNGCDCSDADLGDDGVYNVCVLNRDGEEVALFCFGERWREMPDGQCFGPDPGTSRCRVVGPDFTQIAHAGTIVPSPFSFCNSCTCGADGTLVDCTTRECADHECPSGTVRGERCVRCSVVGGGCATVETGCLAVCESDADCSAASPICEDGSCQVGICP